MWLSANSNQLGNALSLRFKVTSTNAFPWINNIAVPDASQLTPRPLHHFLFLHIHPL